MNDMENKEIHVRLYELLKEVDYVASKNNLTYYLAYGTALGAIREGGFIPWDTDVDIMVTIDKYEEFCSILESQIGKKFRVYSNKKEKKYTALFTRVGLKGVPHHKLHIDIFPMVGTPKSKIGKMCFWRLAYLVHMINYIKKVNITERLIGHSKVIFVVIIGKVILSLVPSKLLVKMHNKLRSAFPIENSDYLYNVSGTYGFKEFIPKNWLGKGERKDFEGLKLPVPEEWDKYLTHLYGDYMTPREKNYV